MIPVSVCFFTTTVISFMHLFQDLQQATTIYSILLRASWVQLRCYPQVNVQRTPPLLSLWSLLHLPSLTTTPVTILSQIKFFGSWNGMVQVSSAAECGDGRVTRRKWRGFDILSCQIKRREGGREVEKCVESAAG